MRKWLAPLLIVASIAFTAAVYPELPDRVATHFGLNGPNGWSPRALAAGFLPAITIVVWGILLIAPKIDPRGANYAQFAETYENLILIIVGALVVLHVLMLGYALGWPISITRLIPVVIGAMIVGIGTLLPNAKSNWFFGIRTPWTLASDRVWDRTHRVGGWLMVAAGLLIAMIGIASSDAWVWFLIATSFALLLSPVVYSYFAWREEREHG